MKPIVLIPPVSASLRAQYQPIPAPSPAVPERTKSSDFEIHLPVLDAMERANYQVVDAGERADEEENDRSAKRQKTSAPASQAVVSKISTATQRRIFQANMARMPFEVTALIIKHLITGRDDNGPLLTAFLESADFKPFRSGILKAVEGKEIVLHGRQYCAEMRALHPISIQTAKFLRIEFTSERVLGPPDRYAPPNAPPRYTYTERPISLSHVGGPMTYLTRHLRAISPVELTIDLTSPLRMHATAWDNGSIHADHARYTCNFPYANRLLQLLTTSHLRNLRKLVLKLTPEEIGKVAPQNWVASVAHAYVLHRTPGLYVPYQQRGYGLLDQVPGWARLGQAMETGELWGSNSEWGARGHGLLCLYKKTYRTVGWGVMEVDVERCEVVYRKLGYEG